MLHLERREMVILGTDYAGEMKKGVFTVMNYWMPQRGVLSMHCTPTKAPTGDVTPLLRPVGHRQDHALGRPAPAADRRRRALLERPAASSTSKAAATPSASACASRRSRRSIDAIRFGAVLENVVFDAESRVARLRRSLASPRTPARATRSSTSTMRKIPCVGGHPRNIIFLTCDAFGVLPPVSRLTPAQAMYHFLSGYTAKVAGTEVGVNEPQVTFSACFGAAFMVLHPARYAELLAERIARPPGPGVAGQHRLVRRALRRRLADQAGLHPRDHRRDPRRRRCRPCRPWRTRSSDLQVPTSCPGVPSRADARATPGPTRRPTTARRASSPPSSATTSRCMLPKHSDRRPSGGTEGVNSPSTERLNWDGAAPGRRPQDRGLPV